MKTRIATFLVVLVMLLINTVSANEPVPASKSVAKSVANLFKSEIDYPDFARETNFECCVLVRVNISEDGTFEVDCINGKSIELKRFVREEIEAIESEYHASFAGQTVSVKVNFKCI